MGKKLILLSLSALFTILVLFGCSQRATTPADTGYVISFALKAPSFAGSVSPKSDEFSTIRVKQFDVKIKQGNTTIVDRTVNYFTYDTKTQQYKFKIALSRAEQLEPGIYTVSVEAKAEGVGPYTALTRIMSFELKDEKIDAGEKPITGDLKFETGTATLVFKRPEGYGSISSATGTVSPLASLQVATNSDYASFTIADATPGVYRVKAKIQLAGTSNESGASFKDVEGEVVVFPALNTKQFVVEMGTTVEYTPDVGWSTYDATLGVNSPALFKLNSANFAAYIEKGSSGATLTVYGTGNNLFGSSKATTVDTGNLESATMTSPVVEVVSGQAYIYVAYQKGTDIVLKKFKFEFGTTASTLLELASSTINGRTLEATEIALADNWLVLGVNDGNSRYILQVRKGLGSSPDSVSGGLTGGSWTFKSSPLVIGEQVIIFAASGTELYAWNTRLGSPSATRTSEGLKNAANIREPVVLDSNVYFITTDGTIGNYDLTNIATLATNVGQPTSDPVAKGEYIYYASGTNRIARFNTVYKTVDATASVDDVKVLLLSQDKVFAAKNGKIYQFADSLGNPEWDITTISGEPKALLLDSDNRKLVVSRSNKTTLVDVKSSNLADGWPRYRGNLQNTGAK